MRTYRELSIKYHPDKNPESAELFGRRGCVFSLVCFASVRQAQASGVLGAISIGDRLGD